jgi:hypothetical protein
MTENTQKPDKLPEILTWKDMTYQYVMYVVLNYKGNRSKSCKVLGISLRTLRNWLTEWKHEKGIIVPSCPEEDFDRVFLRVNRFTEDDLEEKKHIFMNVMKPIKQALISDFGFPAESLEMDGEEIEEDFEVSEEDESEHPCLETSSLT